MADGDAAQDRLRSFIERIERLEEEKAEAALNFKLPVSPLTNFPEVTESIFTKLKVGNWNGDVADVTVKNVGDSTLIYGGYPGFGPTSEMV